METRYPYAPAPGKTDTSKAAADFIASGKHGRLVRAALLAISEAGVDGMTADECARDSDCSVLGMRPRIAELKAMGFIVDSGARRPSSNGRKSIVWILANSPK